MHQDEDQSAKLKWWPAAAALCLFSAIMLFTVAVCVHQDGGHLGYPMDDTYIHMAMAKNISQHGVWGVTRYRFSSSSSSPLYTLLLSAAYLLAGVHEATSLILNIAAAFLLVLFADFAFRDAGIKAIPRFLFLALIVEATPLGALTMGGMEHVFHAVLTLVFVWFCVRSLRSAGDARTNSTAVNHVAMLSAAFVLPLVRYEALFIIALAACLFAWQRRWIMAVLLPVVAGVPVVLFGWFSWMHGWYPLPIGLLIKVGIPGNSDVSTSMFDPRNFLHESLHNPAFLGLIALNAILLWMLWRRDRSVWSRAALSLILFLGGSVLHLQFAKTGWFFRYEAYLMVFGTYVMALALQELDLMRLPEIPRGAASRALAGLAAVVLLAMLGRGVLAIPRTWKAVHSIYEQQYQMGLFVHRYYPQATVVLNDIGAVAFLSDADIFDVVGLGTIDVVRAKRAGHYSTAWIQSYAAAHQAKIAILYPIWPYETVPLPSDWQNEGWWKLRENIVASNDTVGLYAVTPGERANLLSALRGFAPHLPSDVTQYGSFSASRRSSTWASRQTSLR